MSTTAQDQKRTLAQRLFADKGILKHIEAVRNERVLNELYRFDPEWADQILPEKDDAVLPTRLFGEVTVDETACDLCGICMTFCPTGALGGVANEPVNSFVMLNRDIAPKGELSFRANDCMACNLCLDVCPHDALERRASGVSSEPLFPLRLSSWMPNDSSACFKMLHALEYAIPISAAALLSDPVSSTNLHRLTIPFPNAGVCSSVFFALMMSLTSTSKSQGSMRAPIWL